MSQKKSYCAVSLSEAAIKSACSETFSGLPRSRLLRPRFESFAEALVSSALIVDFPIDPLLDTDFSYRQSVLLSAVRRHGFAIQKVIGNTLIATRRMDVLFDQKVILDAADPMRGGSDGRTISVDLLVFDPVDRSLGAYEVKRGNGETDSRRRAAIVYDLKSIQQMPAGYFLKRFGLTVENVRIGVIDYYGRSGFCGSIVLHGEALNRHFGVDVLSPVEALTSAVRQSLGRAFAGVIADPAAVVPSLKGVAHQPQTWPPTIGLWRYGAMQAGSAGWLACRATLAKLKPPNAGWSGALFGDPNDAIGLAIEILVLRETSDHFVTNYLMSLLAVRAGEDNVAASFVFDWLRHRLMSAELS